ncbi:MAG: hypothetical protein LBK58_11915 [Prevotellaceae bacterium]|jgi:hypothetical protein|nr:hypothetical protein [Prevotellaceae bacterium]
MIYHYFKVAFRNMRKYRNQTLVSVAGLAVGFVCFAMATLWIRYEMTYDSFHKNADRMYCVYMPDIFSPTGIRRGRDGVSSYFTGQLKSTFPEIANATTVYPVNMDLEYEGVNHKADMLFVDSSFFSMFDVRIVEGSIDFLISENPENPDSISKRKVAITREKALQMFGNESPVGKKFGMNKYYYYEICAVVSSLPEHSNYPFDFLQISNGGHALVELVPGIDMEAFEKKLYEYDFPQTGFHNIKNISLTSLTSVRYEEADIEREVKFQHIIIFALAGSLLILCTLFNYLTLFVNRFRIRQRELALRTVYGASGRSLFAMLSVEFIMSLIVALILGLAFINIVNSPFRAVSGVKLELSAIYLESTVYIAVVITVALTAFFLTLAIFRRRTLNAGIRGNKKIFRKASIVAQLIISIVFAFCTLVILKQMYYLHSSDLGFSLKNRGSVNMGGVDSESTELKILNDKMKQIPEIKETILEDLPLLPIRHRSSRKIFEWDGKQGDAEIDIESNQITKQYAKFYEFELIEGEYLSDEDDEKYVLINESAAKARSSTCFSEAFFCCSGILDTIV